MRILVPTPCMAFPVLYPQVLRNLSHLRSGAQITVSNGDSKSGTHREGKRPGLFQALEAVGRPKAFTKVYLLATRKTTERVFRGRSLPRQNKKGASIRYTHSPAGCNSDLHVDYYPDRVVDWLVESKVSEKETGNTPGSESHCWISVSWESRRVLGKVSQVWKTTEFITMATNI